MNRKKRRFLEILVRINSIRVETEVHTVTVKTEGEKNFNGFSNLIMLKLSYFQWVEASAKQNTRAAAKKTPLNVCSLGLTNFSSSKTPYHLSNDLFFYTFHFCNEFFSFIDTFKFFWNLNVHSKSNDCIQENTFK